MRIVFVGATGFGLRCLEKVVSTPGCDVAGIVTLPETFAISYRPTGVKNVLYADLSTIATRHNVPVYVAENSMQDQALLRQFQAWNPELVLVVGWYYLVPKALREIAPVIGMHASLLPAYSGGAPLVWAIINGEKKTGITLFRFNDEVDGGPILDQAEESIFDEDTIATLYARIELLGLKLLERSLPAIAAGKATYRAQDHSLRTTYPQRSPEDGIINWSLPAKKIYDFIRAQTHPYPGAWSLYEGSELKVWRSVLHHSQSKEAAQSVPGQIIPSLSDTDDLVICCGGGSLLRLSELEYSGNIMNGGQFFDQHIINAPHANRPILLGR